MPDEGFWHWLAGFIDGEGYLGLMQQKSGTINAKCAIQLRADDGPILKVIRDTTGMGLLTYRQRPQSPKNANPQVSWEVLAIDQCAALANGLMGKMRAKKARDFALWHEAVEILSLHGGAKNKPGYQRLLALRQELSDVKVFRPDIAASFESYQNRRLEGGGYARRSKWSHTDPLPTDLICADYDAGGITQRQLAERYGVSVMVVNRVLRGQYRTITTTGQRVSAKVAALHLSLAQIEQLCEDKRSGLKYKDLMAKYGISRAQVWRYLSGNFIPSRFAA